MFLESYDIQVKTIMSKDFIQIQLGTSVKKISDILIKNTKKEIFITDKKGNLKGVLTLKDLYNIYYKNENSLDELLFKDIISIEPEASLRKCRDLMLNNDIGRLPVISDSKLVGVIRESHIRDYLYMRIEKMSFMLKYIINNINEAVCVVDEQGEVIVWNHKAEDIYDISSDKIMNKPLKNFFPDAIDVKILDTKKEVKDIYHRPRKGTHIIISAAPMYINNEFIGVVSTDRDISEIKKIQTELKQANDLIDFLQKEINKKSNNNFGNVIGQSKIIKEKIEMAKQVAESNASILISGESGSGKEVFARAIHNYSQVDGYFVPVNCGAIPKELFESEFFGYKEGAFTGANKNGKKGLFEIANNGTIFLDEIADLPLPMQAKLLRVLEDHTIKRIGGGKEIELNLRIISATNKDLKEMVKNEEFREDLYYRINVINLDLPPLRNRKEDIVLLFNNFLEELALENKIKKPQVESEVIDVLMNYEWKGNARELKNSVEQMLVLSRGEIITVDLIPEYIRNSVIGDKNKKAPADILSNDAGLKRAVADYESSLIKQALNLSDDNVLKAAEILKVPRTTLHSKIKKYNI